MIETVIKIDGMMCGMCESHINDVIRRNFKVKKVSSSHKKGETSVVSEEALDEKLLEKAIAETGYIFKGAEAHEFEKRKGLFGHFGKK